jgi:general secretion pathway protein E
MKPSSDSGSHLSISDSGAIRSSPGGERRPTPRIAFLEPPLVKVEVDGQTFSALLLDVSSKGAGLRIVTNPPSVFAEGQNAQVSLDSDGTTATRQGRVAWVRTEDGKCRFGMDYVAGSRDLPCLGLLDPRRLIVDTKVALRVPATLAVRRQILPFGIAEGTVHVACGNPQDASALRSVEKIIGLPVRAVPCDPFILREIIDRVYGASTANLIAEAPSSGSVPKLVEATGSSAANSHLPAPSSGSVPKLDEVGPEAIALGDELLQAALQRLASDVHLDPEGDGLLVRFRIDGGLELHRKLPSAAAAGVLSRFKALAGMDIADKRSPQEGGFKHRYGRDGERINVRVATIPTHHGERMTIRLLALQTQSLALERLGCSERDLRIIETALARPHGLILLSGPTGSGKSTTLYAAIRRLIATENLNVLTVEDPIEFDVAGVAQVEVDFADKVAFSKALRSALRHDPDVLMIGEIRDRETADIAVEAALTGHRVLSTLHTHSAASVVTRLVDMGLERYRIAATLVLAVAQRLLRQLCSRCRSPRPLTAAEAAALARPDLAGQTAYDRTGCVHCSGKGYSGRLALFELMALDESWSRMINDGADASALAQRLRENRVPTLLDDGIAKLLSGQTTPRDLIAAGKTW